jgi:hypothetical protein
VKLTADQMKAIDSALGAIPTTDPKETKSPNPRA